MSSNTGKWIAQLRCKRKISQTELARGILSVSELSRHENGEKDIPYTSIEALLQRLGKSCDKFEIQMSEPEYEMFFLRQTLLNNMISSPELFERLCDVFRRKADMERPLERQYLLMMEASGVYFRKNDPEECLCLLRKAFEVTFCDCEADWPKHVLCTQEIQILLLQTYCMLEMMSYKDAKKILDEIEIYLQTHMTDEEEYARTYPQLCYLKTTLAIKQDDYQTACRYIDSGKECLAENGLLTLMQDFLILESQYGEKKEIAKSELCAIEYIGHLASEEQQPLYYRLLRLNQHHSFVLINEIIRDTRRYCGISQEELAWEICSTETLSRIEGGKRTPHRRNQLKLFERLGLDEVSYQVMETDSFEMLENGRKLSGLFYKKELKKAKSLIDEMEKRLDMSIGINRQYINMNRIALDIYSNDISFHEAINRLRESVNISMNTYHNKIYRLPTKNEYTLLTQMAICYKRSGDYSSAERIYNDLYQCYTSTDVSVEHHTREMVMLCVNYATLMNDLLKHDEAEELLKEGIDLSFKCQRGDWLGTLTGNLSFVLRKKKESQFERYRECVNSSFWIFRLYKHEHDANIIKKEHMDVLEKTYGLPECGSPLS